LLAPFPALVLFGLEHPLHILLTLIFVMLASEVISAETPDRARNILLLVVGPLMTAARYEGLFAVFIVAALLAIRKKWRLALGVGVASIIPVVSLGLISIAHGGWFFPNSLIIKGTWPLGLLGHPPRLIVISGLVLIIIFLASQQKRFWQKDRLLVFIFSCLLLTHIAFAWVGWFYRHEAYLVVLGLLLLGTWFANNFDRQKFGLFLILIGFSFSFLLERGVGSINRTVQATTSIYEQQYQMAMFLRENYNTATVAVNDIGAISYFTRIKLLDLAGLGSIDVLREKIKQNGVLSARYLADIAKKKKVSVIMIYPGWFYRQIPASWIKAGEWKALNKSRVLGGETVSFYARDKKQSSQLKKRLREWETKKYW
ncbi:MAG: hypothetical protein ABIH50_05455, partial [bacterium]